MRKLLLLILIASSFSATAQKKFAWVSGTDEAIQQVFLDLPAFSYISQGTGPLYFLVPGLLNTINYVLYCNVFGGILVP